MVRPNRLNSKYYRYRAECNAVNDVQPRYAPGGLFSHSRDRPVYKPSTGGLYGIYKRRKEKKWEQEKRHMQRSDYSRRGVDFARRGEVHEYHKRAFDNEEKRRDEIHRMMVNKEDKDFWSSVETYRRRRGWIR